MLLAPALAAMVALPVYNSTFTPMGWTVATLDAQNYHVGTDQLPGFSGVNIQGSDTISNISSAVTLLVKDSTKTDSHWGSITVAYLIGTNHDFAADSTFTLLYTEKQQGSAQINNYAAATSSAIGHDGFATAVGNFSGQNPNDLIWNDERTYRCREKISKDKFVLQGSYSTMTWTHTMKGTTTSYSTKPAGPPRNNYVSGSVAAAGATRLSDFAEAPVSAYATATAQGFGNPILVQLWQNGQFLETYLVPAGASDSNGYSNYDIPIAAPLGDIDIYFQIASSLKKHMHFTNTGSQIDFGTIPIYYGDFDNNNIITADEAAFALSRVGMKPGLSWDQPDFHGWSAGMVDFDGDWTISAQEAAMVAANVGRTGDNP